MPYTIICDLDGTIADCDHRLGFIRNKPKNWKAFFAGVKNDKVHMDILFMVQAMLSRGATVILATGRPEKTRADTEEWLEKIGFVGWKKLYMRKDGDFRQDVIVKKEFLVEMEDDGFFPTIAIEDRTPVVQMWRDMGLRCIQVERGDF